ncbi:hypothetical protein HHI36_014448 [Cryptolaemus montrouzieri]|uniref:Uncharacterized protein n=1 Tax=Cryptolaemus montrouzieri TaxID=559131 RepID=A0ABD2N2K3_9CUCU
MEAPLPPSDLSEKYSNISNSQEETQPWQEVRRKKSKNASFNKKKAEIVCDGSKPLNNTCNFQGAFKRRWLYVRKKVGQDVSENDVKNYLGDLQDHDLIQVKKLSTEDSYSDLELVSHQKNPTKGRLMRLSGPQVYSEISLLEMVFSEETPTTGIKLGGSNNFLKSSIHYRKMFNALALL